MGVCGSSEKGRPDEPVQSPTTAVLDTVYVAERKRNVQWNAPFLPPGDEHAFANHTPMAVEAMTVLGIPDSRISEWAKTGGTCAAADYEGGVPAGEWDAGLGDFAAVAAYVARADADIARGGWRGALRVWCGRLLPGLGTHFFHGMLRVAHAARALRAADTPARRRELAVGIAHWATRWGATRGAGASAGMGAPGAPPSVAAGVAAAEVERRLLAHAAAAARAFVAACPAGVMDGIVPLHGVTAPLAYLDMLMPELGPDHHRQALEAFDRCFAAPPFAPPAPRTELGPVAFPDLGDMAGRLDWGAQGESVQHVCKLVDAARRAHRRTGDAVFAQVAVQALKPPPPPKWAAAAADKPPPPGAKM